MTDNLPVFKASKRSKIVFLLSLIVSLIWCVGQTVNVYRYAVVGAVYEMIWLPEIFFLIALPVISVIYLFKEKFSTRSLYLYSIIIIGLAILFPVLLK
jgi:hypothetical protein